MGQYVHSYEQIIASDVKPSGVRHFRHSSFISNIFFPLYQRVIPERPIPQLKSRDTLSVFLNTVTLLAIENIDLSHRILGPW